MESDRPMPLPWHWGWSPQVAALSPDAGHPVLSPWDGHPLGAAWAGNRVPPASGGGAPQTPQQLPAAVKRKQCMGLYYGVSAYPVKQNSSSHHGVTFEFGCTIHTS